MQNSTIRFFGSLAFILVLTLVLLALNQSLSNDILMSVLDAQAVAVDSIMTPFMLDIPATSDDWSGVSCSDLNQLAGSTIIDFNDQALVAKLELCNNLQ